MQLRLALAQGDAPRGGILAGQFDFVVLPVRVFGQLAVEHVIGKGAQATPVGHGFAHFGVAGVGRKTYAVAFLVRAHPDAGRVGAQHLAAQVFPVFEASGFGGENRGRRAVITRLDKVHFPATARGVQQRGHQQFTAPLIEKRQAVDRGDQHQLQAQVLAGGLLKLVLQIQHQVVDQAAVVALGIDELERREFLAGANAQAATGHRALQQHLGLCHAPAEQCQQAKTQAQQRAANG